MISFKQFVKESKEFHRTEITKIEEQLTKGNQKILLEAPTDYLQILSLKHGPKLFNEELTKRGAEYDEKVAKRLERKLTH